MLTEGRGAREIVRRDVITFESPCQLAEFKKRKHITRRRHCQQEDERMQLEGEGLRLVALLTPEHARTIEQRLELLYRRKQQLKSGCMQN